MLSPSMMTRSKGKVACSFAICCPTSYCGRSPVPLSPIATNFSEPARLGRATVCATRSATARNATRVEATKRGREDVTEAHANDTLLVDIHEAARTAPGTGGGGGDGLFRRRQRPVHRRQSDARRPVPRQPRRHHPARDGHRDVGGVDPAGRRQLEG